MAAGCGSSSPSGAYRCTVHEETTGGGLCWDREQRTSWATPGSVGAIVDAVERTSAAPLPHRAARRTVTVTHEAMRRLILERNLAVSACEAIATIHPTMRDAVNVAIATARQAIEARDPAPVLLDDVTVVTAADPGQPDVGGAVARGTAAARDVLTGTCRCPAGDTAPRASHAVGCPGRLRVEP